jgi:alpha-amylase
MRPVAASLRLVLLAASAAAPLTTAAQDPAPRPGFDWRTGGVCYEIFVRSFHDSDGDGVGDLAGLIEKLDYINDGDPTTSDDLGATCIWLMPVSPSPSYHGYDVTNYYQVNREYGTNEDFRRLTAEAGRRGIAILVDLVLNHMSSEHPIFRSALLDPASPYREWFRWSPIQRSTDEWSGAVWHRVPDREEYYYGLFWHGMPDLNLAEPAVRAEVERIARFWLEEMGVAGFRLDAVGHFFEDGDRIRHGPGTHAWLRDYHAALRTIRPDVFTVGEVWDSIGGILPYYPDQLDSYFAFEVSDALIEGVRTGSGERLMAAVSRMQREVPGNRWAIFQRNHDQTRTMTELGGDAARARLAATLLLTLPGLPFVYYGEELGMTADKPDPRLRTPMHWALRPAAGFSTAMAWEPLQPDSFTANVEVLERDPSSLLHHYRRLVHLRNGHPALGPGDFVPLETGDPGVLAYLRRAEGRVVLVFANLRPEPASGRRVSSSAAVLPPGRYSARSLFGRGVASTLRAGDDGRIAGWMPVRSLAPHEAVVVELTRAR